MRIDHFKDQREESKLDTNFNLSGDIKTCLGVALVMLHYHHDQVHSEYEKAYQEHYDIVNKECEEAITFLLSLKFILFSVI